MNSLYLKGRNPAIELKIMLKTIIFAYMKCIYSSRKIASVCKYNIEFICLLRGRRAPTHNTICRFIKKTHLI
ncbi:MAG: transposase [Sarcina sp.]